ncbi:MAG: adenylate/guanylate cyclase domain-containing protein [Spirochaetales bacterium]|nr:adenylate/guanylate cyclase domain-containing protein [Spirochaetales bacterium]
MNEILIISNTKNIETEHPYKRIKPDFNVLTTKIFKNIGMICIDREDNSSNILQLLRLINNIPCLINIPIVIVAKYIRNFDLLQFKLTNYNDYVTYSQFTPEYIQDFFAKQNMESKRREPYNKTTEIEIVTKLVFSHNSRQNTINNYLLNAGYEIESIEKTISYLVKSLNTITPNDIIIIILKEGRETKSYSWISNKIKKVSFDDFNNFCLHNHYENFHGINLEGIKNTFISNISSQEFNSMDLENYKISSYFYSPLYNPNGETIGTIHVGNFINNYFNNSEIREILTEHFYSIGSLLHNGVEYRIAQNRNENTLNVFSKFIPKKLIERLLAQGEINRTGEVRRICILFSDIRSFTTISEKNSAENVVSLLNNYFNIMVKCIKDEGGIIDKFIGDAIMAIFGAPENMDNIEQRAVNAAKKMISSISQVNTNNIVLPPIGFNIGIGLHVGDSIVGNIGSKEKKAYTSIGEIASVAEELESLTKKYKTPILITGEVAKFCNGTFLEKKNIDGKEYSLHSVID